MEKDSKIILSDGQEHDLTSKDRTERSIERSAEDSEFTPVIVKRNDDTIRHPDDVLERVIEEGIEQHKRRKVSLLLSAIAAGIILGFAAMCVALANSAFPAVDDSMSNRLAMAIVYPLGFVVSIMSGTQLFTEHTATAVYPVLDKKAPINSLLKLWTTVLAGNFIGTFISSYLIFRSETVIGAGTGFIALSDHLTHFSFGQIFISAVLAGLLMAQAGWLVFATPPSSSQILCIYVVTFIIGLGGLHHSIAGSAEIFAGIFHSETPNYLGSMKFLVASVLGNLFGGSLLVATLNYAHIRVTQKGE